MEDNRDSIHLTKKGLASFYYAIIKKDVIHESYHEELLRKHQELQWQNNMGCKITYSLHEVKAVREKLKLMSIRPGQRSVSTQIFSEELQLQVPLDQPGNRTIESAVLSQNALLEQQKFAEERQNKAFAEPKHLGQNVKRPAGETVKHQTELMAKYREEASKRQANEMAVAAAKIQELQNRQPKIEDTRNSLHAVAMAQPRTPLNVMTQPRTPLNVMTQPRTPLNVMTQPRTPCETMAQPRTPCETMTQPRTPSNIMTRPRTPREIMAQPRTPVNIMGQPRTSLNIIAQPRTPPRITSQPKNPQNSMAKPRTPPNPMAKPRTPPKTIAQPGTSPNGNGEVIDLTVTKPSLITTNGPQPVPGLLSAAAPVKYQHPAPLPECMLTKKKGQLIKPRLELSTNDDGIVLQWNMPTTTSRVKIARYQIYGYKERPGPLSGSEWKKVGELKALPLPMACTLTHFQTGHTYHFAVRAVDELGRSGQFGVPRSTKLG